MKHLNEVKRFQKLAGLLKEDQADQIVDKVEDSLEAKLDQLSPDQIRKLQADLAKLGITADTAVEDAAEKIEGSLDEAEGDDKKKLANALQSIGTGLIGSLLVPIIPVAIGQSTGLGTATGLGITLAAGGLLVGLAKALKAKSGGKISELHPDKEWDEENDEEDNGQDYPSDEELFGLPEEKSGEHYEAVEGFLDQVFNILNDEMRAGFFSEKGFDKANMFLTKHGEKLAKSGKKAHDVADALMTKFNYTVNEDDYSEDPSSDMDDESQSGDTDAMGIDEAEPRKKGTLDQKEKIVGKLQHAIEDYLKDLGLRKIPDEETPKFEKGFGFTRTTPSDAFNDKVRVGFHFMTPDDDPKRNDPRHNDQEVHYNLRIYKPNERFNTGTLRSFIQQAKREAQKEGFWFYDKVNRSNQDITFRLTVR